MSSSRSSRSGGSNNSGKKTRAAQQSVRQLIESLETHRVNALTELCRIERVAAACDTEEDTRAFQGPMTAAWDYYVTTNQMLSELRGLTTEFPFCGDIVTDAQIRVRNDPDSNRSWNLAWLCLVKIIDDNLIPLYAASEAARLEMWDGREPEQSEVDQLAACFEYEWNMAVQNMLRHWHGTPTWY
ncbi:hypothetical protein CONLIGDRAFT_318458 [Coniochaeta ligniaria NRRL 30616]|uniref:Uncharacterized protein n=1 Tax=Coniochaeta ligniaria NRRL 30616 TaxID=1408157 RepID=A0A1J7JDN8_9PEZI|nr:hypothetical protein CONLIGDRAFT_318458 [Coniochaeta ligniaria NRRL 30616]